MTAQVTGLREWEALNERQRGYLGAVYDADQKAEAQARSGWHSRPASQWRWLLYSIKAPKELVGRSTIQADLERQGQLDPGAGSSLAALRRRGLVQVRQTFVELFALGSVPAVEVQITRTGRAAARAGLGITTPPKVPRGLLSRPYLWDALVWLFEAGEQGFEHVYYRADQPPEQKRYRPSWNTLLVLRDRRDGSLWEHPRPEGAPEWKADHNRYRLSPLGQEHYARHWACYAELFPEIDAPRPPETDGAHQGLADHFVRKPRGLLTEPQWRLLVALVRVHRSGTCPLRKVITREHQQRDQPPPDLSDLPNGLLDWYIKDYVTTSSTAAAKLVGYEGGALAHYTDVAHLRRFWHANPAEGGPLPLLHLTETGLTHFTDHLAAYQRLYPDVPVDGADAV